MSRRDPFRAWPTGHSGGVLFCSGDWPLRLLVCTPTYQLMAIFDSERMFIVDPMVGTVPTRCKSTPPAVVSAVSNILDGIFVRYFTTLYGPKISPNAMCYVGIRGETRCNALP